MRPRDKGLTLPTIPQGWIEERAAVPVALEQNRERRAKAEAECRDARTELAHLLARGLAAGFDMAPMARTTGVSRDTAYRLIREVGAITLHEKHRRAEEAGNPPGRGAEEVV